MIKELGPGFRLTLAFHGSYRIAVPCGDDRRVRADFSEASQRQPCKSSMEKLSDRASSASLSPSRSIFIRVRQRQAVVTTRPQVLARTWGPRAPNSFTARQKWMTRDKEVVDFDGIEDRIVHYCIDNNIPYESSVPLDQFKDAHGDLDDVKLIKAFNDDKTPLLFKAKAPIPPDAVTASSSGLDPQISPANAEVQAARIAKARGASADQVRQLIPQFTDRADLGFLGEPRVNVLMLNIALDQKFPVSK